MTSENEKDGVEETAGSLNRSSHHIDLGRKMGSQRRVKRGRDARD